MAILAECPVCHKKQSVTNKACRCGVKLDAEKKNKKVRYHIVYRLPEGKQVWRSLASFENCDPCSLKDAREIESKYNVCKKENRLEVFERRPEATMTLKELSEWYLKLEKVRALKSYWRVVYALDNFNKALGHMVVKKITSVDLENYQAARKAEGKADATIDQEIGAAKSVINKAFENDLVSGKVLRTFKSVGKMLKPRANKRDKVLSVEQALSFAENCPSHIRPVFMTAYWTGMRKGEILNLTWDRIDMKEKLIRLAGNDTKSGRSRTIPISQALFDVLKGIPRAIHVPHVFLFRGKPIRDIRTSIKQGCDGAGIAYGRFVEGSFVFHDIRHTFNTDMRRAGVHLSVIMAVMGHEDPGMFFRYDTVDVEDLRQAMTRLEAYRDSVRHSVRQEAQAG